MKLALICSDKGPCPPVRGGAIQLLVSKIAPLLAEKYEVTVFSISDPELPAKEVKEQVKYERYAKESFIDEVVKRVKEEQFSIIQVHNRPNWVPRLRSANRQAVILLFLHNLLFAARRIPKEEAIEGIRDVDQILTVSKFVLKDTVSKVPAAKEKIRVMHTGVDLKDYFPTWTKKGQEWRRSIRSQYGIREKDPVILFVGRLVPEKGCHVVIEAMKKIVKQHKNAKLLIVGSNWYGEHSETKYSKNLKEMSRSISKNVIFTSYVPVDKIPQYFSSADLFVCASQWQEPLARVHYEAMAAGLPIITTNRGGNQEVICEGKNGLLINHYKLPERYVSRVNRLLSNPKLARKMGEEGRKLTEKLYNFERVAKDLTEIYQSLQQRK